MISKEENGLWPRHHRASTFVLNFVKGKSLRAGVYKLWNLSSLSRFDLADGKQFKWKHESDFLQVRFCFVFFTGKGFSCRFFYLTLFLNNLVFRIETFSRKGELYENQLGERWSVFWLLVDAHFKNCRQVTRLPVNCYSGLFILSPLLVLVGENRLV